MAENLFEDKTLALTCPIYALVMVCLLILSYRVVCHPLSRFPGPLLAKCTKGYGAFYALRRSLHLKTFHDHQKYGPVVSHGPNKLVFNTVTALRQIYQSERVTKPVTYLANQAKPGSHNTWNSLNRDTHCQKRKSMALAVSERSMKSFEPIIIEQIDIFLKQISTSRQCPPNLKDRCNYLGMDIVGLLAFGFPLRCQTDPEHRFFADYMPVTNRRLNDYTQVPFVPQYRVQNLINLIWYRDKERGYRLIEHMVKSRMQQAQDARHDFYSFVAEGLATPEGRVFAPMISGWKRLATRPPRPWLLCFFYLAHHAECYSKLANEIRFAFQNGNEISGSGLARCQYLRACIDETLRLSPPIPGTLWRQQDPDDIDDSPFVVDGHVIPRGTYVGVNSYAIQHNEEYFPGPFSFKPERWIESKEDKPSSNATASMLEAFAAFSTGSRGCPGKAMAYMELGLVVAKSLWYFDFEPAPGELGKIGRDATGEFRLHDVYILTHDGKWVSFAPRSTFIADFSK
ncbi:cytochrome P450 [Xylariaceae sp. FL1272]|nr:cytochrome P450 [Xylariaceae sp. FL1272]